MSQTAMPLTEGQLKRNRIFATSGAVIEWYDFMLYGLLATTLQQVFYPTSDASVGLILTFASFAIGYLARPIGGLVIGRLGDTRGRKFALVLATTLMVIPLFVTTFLPGYDQIGLWAPVLLTLMRLMQGFSVGGEYTGVLTTLSESADSGKRGRSVSLGLATAMGGNVLAALVVMTVTVIWGSAALESGTWRIPYFIGLILAVVSVLLQSRIRETESFEKVKVSNEARTPVRELFKQYPGASFMMLVLATWSGVTAYTLLTWMPSYLEDVLGFGNAQADALSAFISVVYIVAVFPVASLGDRVGRRRLMFWTVAAYLVLAIPAFLALQWSVVIVILVSLALVSVMQTFVDSTTTTEMTTLVPTRVRYTGMAITYSIGMIIGSFTPAVEETLVTITGSPLVPAFVVIGMSLLALPVLIVLPRYVRKAQVAEDASKTDTGASVT